MTARASVAAVAEEDLDEVPDENLLRTENGVRAVLVALVHLPLPLFSVDQQRHTRVGGTGVDRLHDLFDSPLAQRAYPTGIEGPGPSPILDIFAAALFQDHAIDSAAQQEIADGEPGNPAAHDDHSGVLVWSAA